MWGKSKKAITKKKVVAKKKVSKKSKAHIFIDSKTQVQFVPHDGRRITSIPPPDKTK
jgi:hypothetical protein